MSLPASERPFSAAFIAQSLGLSHSSNGAFTKITTDSRQVEPGCLFIAIRGERFDGHNFIEDAWRLGAEGVVCERDYTPPAKSGAVFTVGDTLVAYRAIAAAWRRLFDVPIIAVAGSVGKTTTKEFLGAILTGRWPRLVKTAGSQNGFLGIPMTLLELRADHQAAVIEVGIDDIGAMRQHITLVDPTAAVLTAIGPEHLEKLLDLATVTAEERLALTETAHRGGFVAVNMDDPAISPLAGDIPGCLTYGLHSSKAALHGRLENNALIVSGCGLTSLRLALPLPGNHNAANLLSAVALARGLGLNGEEIARGLQTFRGAEGRSEVARFPRSTVILRDYYNANPTSVEAALDVIVQLAGNGRTWVCLGDMLELGKDEESLHRGLATKILTKAIDRVLLYGPRMKALADELNARGFPGRTVYCASHDEAAKTLREGMTAGDALLIKGSRGMKMETVWRAIEAYGEQHW